MSSEWGRDGVTLLVRVTNDWVGMRQCWSHQDATSVSHPITCHHPLSLASLATLTQPIQQTALTHVNNEILPGAGSLGEDRGSVRLNRLNHIHLRSMIIVLMYIISATMRSGQLKI